MPETSVDRRILLPVIGLAPIAETAVAKVAGMAAGIPEPAAHSVVVQLFNWRFGDVTAVCPT